jgi:hypothetical protein
MCEYTEYRKFRGLMFQQVVHIITTELLMADSAVLIACDHQISHVGCEWGVATKLYGHKKIASRTGSE